MKYILSSIILIASLAWMSCDKSNITEEATGLKGTWNLIAITGGIAGNGYVAKFDALRINESTYDLLKSKAILYTGIYVVSPGSAQPDTFKITSNPNNTDLVFPYNPKKIEVTKDKLVLTEPCCDLYTYEFSRVVN